MANSILISTAILLTATLLSSSAAAAHDLDLYFPATTPASCSSGSSIEECMLSGGEEEDDFAREALPEELGGDEESIRRVLYWRRWRYISYGALLRDRVPCSRRGYSYYNCRPGARANPYTRGCSAIARCRSF